MGSDSSTSRNAWLTRLGYVVAVAMAAAVLYRCTARNDDTSRNSAPSVNSADSLLALRSQGVSTLISDSGVLRYKIVAEVWDIQNNTNPATWYFPKGLLLTRFDQERKVDLYVQADTAYLHEQRTWELRGRVNIKNLEGTLFRTEEFFWDMDRREMWSNLFMRITTPTRELQGTTFRSNEQMTDYFISNSAGAFPSSDTDSKQETSNAEAQTAQPDTANLTPAPRQAEQKPSAQEHSKLKPLTIE